MKRALLVATVQSHIGQFHKPLMKLLKENGWEIHVAARNNLGEKDSLQLEYPDEVFDIPFQRFPLDRRNFGAYRQLKKIIKSHHYDVIHCNTPVGGILTRMAAGKAREMGTEVYYTAHGFHFYKGGPLKNWLVFYPLEKLFSHCTDKLVTINQEDYDLAATSFSCPVYHIHGVGADTSRYMPVSPEEYTALREKLGLSGTVLLTAGELLPNKNQRFAILTLKELLKDIPDVHLLIAGNGPERPRLEQLVKELDLGGRVAFLGYTRSLPQYMQVCDAFLSFSYREGLPLNIVEAMLCGKPVVASDNRGHRELIQPGINGFLISPIDPEAARQGILNALTLTTGQCCSIPNTIQQYTDRAVTDELRKVYGLN